MTARPGFTVATWRGAPVFEGHCATPADVEGAAAVFALADTLNGRPLPMQKPAPVIWYADDEEFAALVVQAEAHETDDNGPLDFLGLLLPGGGTAVVFPDDVEFVSDTDPVWQSLLEADSAAEADDEDEDDDLDEDADAWAGLDAGEAAEVHGWSDKEPD